MPVLSAYRPGDLVSLAGDRYSTPNNSSKEFFACDEGLTPGNP